MIQDIISYTIIGILFLGVMFLLVTLWIKSNKDYEDLSRNNNQTIR